MKRVKNRWLAPYAQLSIFVAMVAIWGCSSGGSGGSSVLPYAASNQPARLPTSDAQMVGLNPMTVPPGPYHIATWAYDEYLSQGQSASATSVNQLLTYAEAPIGNNKAKNDCHSVPNGCLAVAYTDPNHLYAGPSCTQHPAAEILAVAQESWFVHDAGYSDASHRVHGVWSPGCNVWEMNPNVAGYQAWWLSYLRYYADKFDLYFADDDYMKLSLEAYFSHFGGGCQPLPSMCTSTQEIPDDAHQVVAHANFFNAMSHRHGSPMKFIFQNTSFDGALDASIFAVSSHVVGMTCEACVTSIANPTLTAEYAKSMDEIATIHLAGGVFVLIAHGNSPTGSPTQTLQRVLTTAFTWLVYKEGYTVVWPDLENQTTNLAVWPEDLIYPSVPLQTMTSGHLDLQVAPGIYRREFSTCYQKGLYIGRCAAIVNANLSAVTIRSSWLRQTYGDLVTLRGGDVLSGGWADIGSGAVPFVPNSTSVQAGGALLLVQ